MSDKFGVTTVDTGYLNRVEYAASYLIHSESEVAIIETNTNFAVPKILKSLENSGFSPENVKYIFLTHVHLDHAGGAGRLMELLPNAKLLVHPRGARHIISPGKLIESVKSVYGEAEFKGMYGDIVPVAKNRVVETFDGMTVDLGKKSIDIFDSPGHAKHHIVIFDKSTGTLFSGDSFGIGYTRFRYEKGIFIFPSTSPVQFDPNAALETYEKIEKLSPESVYLTHFGGVENIDEIKRDLISSVEFIVSEGKSLLKRGMSGKALSDNLLGKIWEYFDMKIFSLRGKHLTSDEKEFLFLDADLNSKGVAFYLERAGM